MKIWNTPQVREEAVGLEVTSYLHTYPLNSGKRGRAAFPE